MLDPRKGQYVWTECTNFMTKDFFTNFSVEATKIVWIGRPKFSNHNTLKHHNFSVKSITKKGRWWRIVLVLKWQHMKLNSNAMWRGFKWQKNLGEPNWREVFQDIFAFYWFYNKAICIKSTGSFRHFSWEYILDINTHFN